jgi:hypothetical protein
MLFKLYALPTSGLLVTSEAMSILYCPIEPILSLTSRNESRFRLQAVSLQADLQHQKGKYIIRYNLKY